MGKGDLKLKSRILELFDKKNGRLRSFIMLLLAGICLMIIIWPVNRKETANDKNTSISTSDSNNTDSEDCYSQIEAYTKQLENKLTSVLSTVDGVGDVHVMITLKDHGENIVEKDAVKSNNIEGANNSNSYEEKTVSSKTQDYDGPYVKKTIEPGIEGVIISCQGGGNTELVLKITEAVQALFDVPVHKIVVLESN